MLFNAYRPLGGFEADTANHFIFYPGWLIPLSPVTILFASGLLLATLPPVPTTVHPAGLAMVALVAWTAALGASFPTATPNYLLLAIAYGATLLAAQRVHFPRSALRLGDVSYGFYLVHVIAIAAVLRAIQHSGTSLRFAMTWAMMAGAAVALGLGYGWLESQFHHRVVKRLFRRHRKAA